MSRLDEIYSEVVKKYRERHNDSVNGLSTELNKLTALGKTWQEAVLHFALELGVEIPEIEKLVKSGMSQEVAIFTFSGSLETEGKVLDVYRPSSPSRTQSPETSPSLLWYLLPILFGLLGAIVGYVAVRAEDMQMADNILNMGIIFTIIDVLLFVFVVLPLL